MQRKARLCEFWVMENSHNRTFLYLKWRKACLTFVYAACKSFALLSAAGAVVADAAATEKSS